MKLLNKLISKYYKLVTPKVPAKLEFAFEVGGINYFKFHDYSEIPFYRALKVTNFWEQFNANCSKQYLIDYSNEVEKILKTTPFTIENINRLFILNAQLKERLKFIVVEDLAYQLASVMYIQDGEDLEKYDFAFNEKKIEHWKKYAPSAFFLSMPIRELIHIGSMPESDMLLYTQVQAKINKIHLDTLYKS